MEMPVELRHAIIRALQHSLLHIIYTLVTAARFMMQLIPEVVILAALAQLYVDNKNNNRKD